MYLSFETNKENTMEIKLITKEMLQAECDKITNELFKMFKNCGFIDCWIGKDFELNVYHFDRLACKILSKKCESKKVLMDKLITVQWLLHTYDSINDLGLKKNAIQDMFRAVFREK